MSSQSLSFLLFSCHFCFLRQDFISWKSLCRWCDIVKIVFGVPDAKNDAPAFAETCRIGDLLAIHNLILQEQKMQVIINSDNQVDLNEAAIQHWQEEVTTLLQRFSDWITRVEVHLTDENSNSKGGIDDIRCLLEARPAGKQPVSIEVRGATVEQALSEGIQTLKQRLGTMQDKARTQQRKST